MSYVYNSMCVHECIQVVCVYCMCIAICCGCVTVMMIVLSVGIPLSVAQSLQDDDEQDAEEWERYEALHLDVDKQVRMLVWILRMYIYVCVHACVSLCVYTCVCVCVCVCVCSCVYGVCVCVYAYCNLFGVGTN